MDDLLDLSWTTSATPADYAQNSNSTATHSTSFEFTAANTAVDHSHLNSASAPITNSLGTNANNQNFKLTSSVSSSSGMNSRVASVSSSTAADLAFRNLVSFGIKNPDTNLSLEDQRKKKLLEQQNFPASQSFQLRPQQPQNSAQLNSSNLFSSSPQPQNLLSSPAVSKSVSQQSSNFNTEFNVFQPQNNFSVHNPVVPSYILSGHPPILTSSQGYSSISTPISSGYSTPVSFPVKPVISNLVSTDYLMPSAFPLATPSSTSSGYSTPVVKPLGSNLANLNEFPQISKQNQNHITTDPWNFDLLNISSSNQVPTSANQSGKNNDFDIFDVGFLDAKKLQAIPPTVSTRIQQKDSSLGEPILTTKNRNQHSVDQGGSIFGDVRLDWYDENEAPVSPKEKPKVPRRQPPPPPSRKLEDDNITQSPRLQPARSAISSAVESIQTAELYQTASAIGATVFSNAKTVFNFSKKKISEVVEMAKDQIQDRQVEAGNVPQLTSRTNFRRYTDYSDDDNENNPTSNSRITSYPDATKFPDDSSTPQLPKRPDLAWSNDSTPASHQWASPSPQDEVFDKITLPPLLPTILNELTTLRNIGNDHFKLGQYDLAATSYTAALLHAHKDPITPGDALHSEVVTLLNNRAAAQLKTGEYTEVIKDCSCVLERANQGILAVEHDPPEVNAKALVRRADALEKLEKWEEAEGDYRMLRGLGVVSFAKVAGDGLRRCKDAVAKTGISELLTVQVHEPVKKVDWKEEKRVNESVRKAVDGAVQRLREQNETAEREDALKLSLKDELDAKVSTLRWRGGKEGNLRALLSSLDTVLWKELAWKTIQLSELVTPQQVKVRYMKAVAKVHPDKLAQDTSVENRLIAAAVFSTLNQAWDHFKKQNGL
ncbi:hypothetical protein HK096_003886 [Nowakowskiella sp. JEL0078]|nr:hypothetical protein HK096_003886 [Nowakowskiella sp. JEL0078]